MLEFSLQFNIGRQTLISEKMNIKPILKCQNGHQAEKMCRRPTCTKYSALICSESTCIYSTIHSKCCMDVNCLYAFGLLEQKGVKSQILDDLMIENCNKIIKIVQRQRQQYHQLINKPQMKLFGNDRDLFLHMIKGESKNIKPANVSTVLENLQGGYQQAVNQLHQRLSSNSTIIFATIETIIIEMTKWRKITPHNNNFDKNIKVKTQMDQSLRNSRVDTEPIFTHKLSGNAFSIKDDGKKIIKSQNDQTSRYALISPEITKFGKIRLEVVRGNGNFYVGLANLHQIQENDYKWPSGNKRIFLVHGKSGTIYNSLVKAEHKIQSAFRFCSGDVLQLIYNSSSNQLKIQNMSSKLCIVLTNIKQLNGNPLHFCVSICSDQDIVKIVPQNIRADKSQKKQPIKICENRSQSRSRSRSRSGSQTRFPFKSKRFVL